MRNQYDEVVHVQQLQRPMSAPRLERANGYAVRLENQWFWFSGLEPAYTFGRAARMSIQVRDWDLLEAATESRFDEGLQREVLTLYVVVPKQAKDRPIGGRATIRRFAAGSTPDSSNWSP